MAHLHKKLHRLLRHKRRLLIICLIIAIFIAVTLAPHIQHKAPESEATMASKSVTTNSPHIYGISLSDSFIRLSSAEKQSQLDAIKKIGFSEVRFTISWYVVQTANQNNYDWKLYDNLVALTTKAGLSSDVIIQYTPQWARTAACVKSAYCAPKDPNEYANFAAHVASRYAKQGIHNYEIWNEPNIKSFWMPTPSAAAYANLLKAAYIKIKSVDPKSKIISGGMSGVSIASPGYIEPRTYLTDLYAAGFKNYFDALGYHAYTFPQKPNEIEEGKNAWAKINTISPSLRSIMVQNGDTNKKIWITEVGAPTNGPGNIVSESVKRTATSDHVDQQLQLEIAQQAIANFNSSDFIQGLFWYTYKDTSGVVNSNENFYGLVDSSGNQKAAFQAFNFLSSNTKQ